MSPGPHRTSRGWSLASQTSIRGAGKWIKVFEEETMGKLFAVGDIKIERVKGGRVGSSLPEVHHRAQ